MRDLQPYSYSIFPAHHCFSVYICRLGSDLLMRQQSGWKFGSCRQSISCWISAVSVTFDLFVVSAQKFVASLCLDHL